MAKSVKKDSPPGSQKSANDTSSTTQKGDAAATAAATKKPKSKAKKGKGKQGLSVWTPVLVVAALAVLAPFILHWTGLMQIEQMKEMVDPLGERISHTVDEGKLMVTDFVTRLHAGNMTIEFPDMDPTKIWERISGSQNTTDTTPGVEAREAGLKMKYPVIYIPGFTSVGLEIWEADECLKHYFRQRVWGTSSMVQALLADRMCWLAHMKMHNTTGLDPDGIKLRAATGLEAADYVFAGYWVWGKIIENLAEIDYTSNEMFMAAYDWRMSPMSLEIRDSYMTKLQSVFETSLKIHGKPAVTIAHSYGSQVLYFFMKWVESKKGGNGGADWCEKHIHGFVNIAGSMLGVPKAYAAILSGEFKDTAQLGSMSAALDYYLSPEKRAELMRSWSSLTHMMPKGGNMIWGNSTWAPDDSADMVKEDEKKQPEHSDEPEWQKTSFGQMLSFMHNIEPPRGNLTAEESWQDLILPRLGQEFMKEVGEANVVAADIKNLHNHRDYDDHYHWGSPLASALPNAPSMKMWCFYGANQSAERGYIYKASVYLDEEAKQHPNDISVPYMLNNAYSGYGYDRGMRLTNGDGSVPLLSLGYMCNEGWTNQKYPYNPAKIPITTVEFPHEPAGFSLRGGGKSSDHIDIMGNTEMMHLILKIVAGEGDKVEGRLISPIKEISANIDLTPIVDRRWP